MIEAICNLVVIGAGVPAATAALAIARAFGPLKLKITWVRTRSSVPEHLALATPPDIRAFHRLLHVGEAELLPSTAATLRFADQFAGWSGEGSAFLHAYGEAGSAFQSLPFIQYWTRARHAGLRVALEDFCLAAAAAKQGRVRTDPGAPPVHYGYHVDVGRYGELLTGACTAAGVRLIESDVPQLVASEGRIQSLTLADGRNIPVDLLIDANGAAIDALDPAADISATPFCDRFILASAPALSPLPTYGRVAAHSAGYLMFYPLQDRTAIRLAYASRFMADDEAAALLPRITGLPLLGRGEPTALPARWRSRPWVGNCIAIGPAAGEPEPLDAAPMLALQLAVGQLVLTWPVGHDMRVEAGIYNEEVCGQRARIADFSAQHFHLNRRTGEPFWDETRARAISPELRAKLDLFAARGKFAHGNHEAHVEDSWALAMAGHGLVPRSSDPGAALAKDPELMAEFQRQLRAIAQGVGGMETHGAALMRLSRPPA